MIERVVRVLAPSLKGSKPGVPLVMPAKAVPRPRQTKCRIPSRQVGLRIDDDEDIPGLFALYHADKRHQLVDNELDMVAGLCLPS
jgi:hypothetical protein